MKILEEISELKSILQTQRMEYDIEQRTEMELRIENLQIKYNISQTIIDEL